MISSHLRLKDSDTNSCTEMVSPLTIGVSSMKNSSTLSTAAMREREVREKIPGFFSLVLNFILFVLFLAQNEYFST